MESKKDRSVGGSMISVPSWKIRPSRSTTYRYSRMTVSLYARGAGRASRTSLMSSQRSITLSVLEDMHERSHPGGAGRDHCNRCLQPPDQAQRDQSRDVVRDRHGDRTTVEG